MGIEVSISCTAYNQGKYIKRTLESLLMQNTNFSFEILVHDDASTDNTVEIIKEYEEKYPHIIKPIYQSENQYTKNIEVNYAFNYTRAKGKYIAYCEADDYWTDPNKLQKQYDFMENHTNVSACIHACKSIKEDGSKILTFEHLYDRNAFLGTEEILSIKSSIATNSVFMRNYFTDNEIMPQWYFDAGVSDDPLFMFLSTKGDIYYMDEIMCAYRVASDNSWTKRVLYNANEHIKHRKKMIDLLISFNSYTNYEFKDSVLEQIDHNKKQCLLADKTMRKTNPKEFQKLYKLLSQREKLKLNISYYLPLIVKMYKVFKNNRISTVFKPKEVFPLTKR